MTSAQQQVAIRTLERSIRTRTLRIEERQSGAPGCRETDRNPEAADGTNLLIVERDALRETLKLVKEHKP